MCLHRWCLTCSAPPQSSCRSNHKVVDTMKDVHNLESLLEEKSAEVSNYLNESVAKREETQEHLQAEIETFKSIMTRNSSCILELRSKIAKEAWKNYLTPTDTPVSFISILRTLKEQSKRPKKRRKRLTFCIDIGNEFPI